MGVNYSNWLGKISTQLFIIYMKMTASTLNDSSVKFPVEFTKYGKKMIEFGESSLSLPSCGIEGRKGIQV